jgi:hypothetical protein
MNARNFALINGALYFAVGLLGLLSFLVMTDRAGAPGGPPAAGYLFGLFAVNSVLNFVHLLIGAWGLTAFWGMVSARNYARSAAVILGILAVMGLLPVLDSAFGFMPLAGFNVALHALTAIAAAYVGYGMGAVATPAHAERRRRAPERRMASQPVPLERRHGTRERRRDYGTLAPG